jgi:hypothetical protein
VAGGSLPFTVRLFYGAARAVGLVRLEGLSLLFEFEVKDGLLGLVCSNLREVRVPLAEVTSLDLEHGWLGDTLVLRVSTLRIAKSLPSHEGGTIRLNLAVRDRAAAASFVVAVRAALYRCQTEPPPAVTERRLTVHRN